MGFADVVYNTFIKRNSVYIAVIIGGAFAGEKLVHTVGDSMWESNNKGKLWKHLEADLQKA